MVTEQGNLESVLTESRHPDWDRRAAAAHALARFDDPRALDRLAELAQDPDDLAVVEAAADELASKGDAGIDALLRAYALCEINGFDELSRPFVDMALAGVDVGAVLKRRLAETDDPLVREGIRLLEEVDGFMTDHPGEPPA